MKREVKNKRLIGILGGAGPAATANIYKGIIAKAQVDFGAVLDCDFPELLIYNLPLSDFSERGFISPDKMNVVFAQLKKGILTLQNAGVDLIVIACNTTHYYYSELAKLVNIPVVNLVDETSNQALRLGLKSVAVLSSRSTRDLDLYGKVLKELYIKCEAIDDDIQEKIDRIILNVMAGKISTPDIESLQTLERELICRGVQGVILGCTELSIVQDQIVVPFEIVDSATVAIDLILKNFKK